MRQRLECFRIQGVEKIRRSGLRARLMLHMPMIWNAFICDGPKVWIEGQANDAEARSLWKTRKRKGPQILVEGEADCAAARMM